MESTPSFSSKSFGNTKKRRKVSSTEPGYTQADRKREQNRISQQRLRERQLAHTRQLESVLEDIKRSNESQDGKSAYSKLLDAHLKVIGEKRQLEDALLRLRKKLLSASNLAATAADDEIFHHLLNGENSRGNREKLGTAQFSTTPLDAPEHLDVSFEAPRHPSSPDFPIEGASIDVSLQWSDDHMLSAAVPQLPTDMVPSTGGQVVSITPYVENVPSTEFLRFPRYNYDFNLMGSQPFLFTQPQSNTLVPSFQPKPSVAISSSYIFAEKIESLCRKYLSQSLRERFPSDPNPSVDHEYGPAQESRRLFQTQLVRRLASAAVALIGSFANLDGYIYGANFNLYLEHVMRWRICRTVSNRLSIPEPFRPTPLQCTSSGYSVIIDFMNWPEIRDQMILNSNRLDIDAMSRDLVQNTVIEMHERKIAVKSFNLLYASILPRSSRYKAQPKKTSIHDPAWTFVEVTSDSPFFGTSPNPAEDILSHELSWHMQHSFSYSTLPTDGTDSEGCGVGVGAGDHMPQMAPAENLDPGISSPPTWDPRVDIDQLKTYFAVDQVKKWKLSKDIVALYPQFDFSSALTSYDTLPAYSGANF